MFKELLSWVNADNYLTYKSCSENQRTGNLDFGPFTIFARISRKFLVSINIRIILLSLHCNAHTQLISKGTVITYICKVKISKWLLHSDIRRAFKGQLVLLLYNYPCSVFLAGGAFLLCFSLPVNWKKLCAISTFESPKDFRAIDCVRTLTGCIFILPHSILQALQGPIRNPARIEEVSDGISSNG
jgi:hypothetical protein